MTSRALPLLGTNGNGAGDAVVVVSSLVAASENPGDIADKLPGEFGFSKPQSRLLADYLINQGVGVLACPKLLGSRI